MVKLPYFDKLNPKDIWCIEQNKPSLVADDLEELFDVPRDVSYSILLARGIFKWLACRRDIIKLKDNIKDEVKQTLKKIQFIKKQLKRTPHEQRYHNELHYWRGYLKAKEQDRKAIRIICHSERFRAPDFDKKANEFLQNHIDKELKNENFKLSD